MGKWPGWVHTAGAGSSFILKPHWEADPRASEGAEDNFMDELEDERQGFLQIGPGGA